MMERERRLAMSTAALALAASALGAYVFFVERRGVEHRDKTTGVGLLPFAAESATALEIDGPGIRIACRKEQGRWRMVAPIQTGADDSTVSRLLDDIDKSRIQRTLPTPASGFGAYGLAKPVAVTVSSLNQRLSFDIGKLNPTGEFVFVREQRPSAPVLLLDQRLRHVAETSLYDLREKSVLAVEPESVRAIVFDWRGRKVRLVRSPSEPGTSDAAWELVEPMRARADRGLVNRALEEVTGLRAEAFVRENQADAKKFGLDNPTGSVRLESANGSAGTLRIGKKTTEAALTRWYACLQGSAPIFTINDNLPGDAQKSFSEWRDRHAADFTRGDVVELRLISPRQTVVIVKTESAKGDEWRLAEFSGPVAEGMNLGAAARTPTAARADRDRVEGLLQHLSALEANAFLDRVTPGDPRFGLTPPALKVVAMDKAGKTMAAVAFGARHGRDVYATTPHLGVVFLVSASDMEPFRARAENLAAR
jgi:hypothetical protein